MEKNVYGVQYAKVKDSGMIGEWCELTAFPGKLEAFDMIHNEQMEDFQMGESGKYVYRVVKK